MSLETDIKLLSRAPMFADLGPEHLRLLAFGADARSYDENDVIYSRGQKSDAGYIVVRGKIRLHAGNDGDVVSTLGAGALLCELGLITETTHSATAVAAEACHVLKLPRPLFRRMLVEYPECAQMLQGRISRTLSETMSRLEAVRIKLDRADEIALKAS